MHVQVGRLEGPHESLGGLEPLQARPLTQLALVRGPAAPGSAPAAAEVAIGAEGTDARRHADAARADVDASATRPEARGDAPARRAYTHAGSDLHAESEAHVSRPRRG